MPASVRIRDVRWEDCPDLVQNYYECYDERDRGEEIGIILFPSKPSMAEETTWFARMFARVQDGSEVALVADDGGHAVGLCQVTRRGSGAGSEVGHVGELGLLLRRSHRGRGIGEALMRATIARCEGSFGLIVLSVFAQNERAKGLYRKLGFERYGTLPGAIRRGALSFDSDEMFLRLGQGAGSPRA